MWAMAHMPHSDMWCISYFNEDCKMLTAMSLDKKNFYFSTPKRMVYLIFIINKNIFKYIFRYWSTQSYCTYFAFFVFETVYQVGMFRKRHQMEVLHCCKKPLLMSANLK